MAFYISKATTGLQCYHCGTEIDRKHVVYDQKDFCCDGCKSVFQILQTNNMESFYDFSDKAGATIKNQKRLEEYAFLDHEQVVDKLLDYKSEGYCKVTFNAPAIHCSSCVWLLENLYKLHEGVLGSEVNFVKKEIYISYNPQKISFKDLVFLLASIGYEPEITLENMKNSYDKTHVDRSIWYKLGVAGFAFGNIMLFSFPTYFGLDEVLEKDFDVLFKGMNLLLSLPVLFYSASEFLSSAFKALKNRQINLDVPLCIGMLALYANSLFELFSGTGPGYFDSFAALVFFLLAGRAIQKLSFQKLRFDRDNSSYFPLSVIKLVNGGEQFVPIIELQVGDVVLVRDNELIPADAQLLRGEANIDYSFVTGESLPVTKKPDELLYAGGRQVGGAIEVSIQKIASQSYLNQLWDSQINEKYQEEDYESIVNKRSKYFTYSVLTVAFGAFLYWTIAESLAKGILVMATTLNVSCPCALAVAIPFTYANIIKILGKHRFFLKNQQVVERMTKADTVVFDKTGTITVSDAAIQYEGKALSPALLSMLKSGIRQSTHPLSTQLYKHLQVPNIKSVSCETVLGKGLRLVLDETEMKLGAKEFVLQNHEAINFDAKTAIYVSVNGSYMGRFVFDGKYVNNLANLVADLKAQHLAVHLLSGDNNAEEQKLKAFFTNDSQLVFNQKPEQKLAFVSDLQQTHKVIMVGDGLNDSVALKESYVGIAVVHEHTQFSPSSDAILAAGSVGDLAKFVRFCGSGISVVKGSFLFSSLYNAFGLCFAVQGLFSPVFAAILMPISSITTVLFAVLLTNWHAKRILNN